MKQTNHSATMTAVALLVTLTSPAGVMSIPGNPSSSSRVKKATMSYTAVPAQLAPFTSHVSQQYLRQG
jgi:hypothetical protein